jgi:hypothetical protein
MKRLLIVVVGLLVFNSSARADDGGMMQGQMQHKGMKMDQQGSMSPMCPMMGDHTMPMKSSMKDMMQSMLDMMKMQQKMMKGVKPAEKRAMMIQMDKKIDQMEKMMTDMPCMQNQNSSSAHDHDSMEK